MSTEKLISVFGSTGSQGGSVIKSLLKDGKYKVRAFTRNPESPSALELKKQGVQVYKLDLDQSEEDLKKGMEGSYGVFLLTSMEREEEYGKKAAKAAFMAGVKHVVFSGLAPCYLHSNGRILVTHFDEKHKVELYLRLLSQDKPEFISSFIYAPFYFQNFQTFFKPQKQSDGSYILSLPQDPKVPLDMGDIRDIGALALAQFNNPKEFSGKIIPFVGSRLTGDQIAEALSKSTGKTVKYQFIPPNVFAKNPFPKAEELANMFQYYNEYGAFYKLDTTIAPKIAHITTFDEFLKSSNFIQLDQ
eukprot:gene6658-8237_t